MELIELIDELEGDCKIFEFDKENKTIIINEWFTEYCEDGFIEEWSEFLIAIDLEKINSYTLSKHFFESQIWSYFDDYIYDFLKTPVEQRKLENVDFDNYCIHC